MLGVVTKARDHGKVRDWETPKSSPGRLIFVTDHRWDWWTTIWLELDLDARRLRFGYGVESTISRIKRRAVGVVGLGERDTGRASAIREGRGETWDVPSIFPPLGHGPTPLRVQKAGQVARPVRM